MQSPIYIISLPGKYGSDSFLPSYVMICTWKCSNQEAMITLFHYCAYILDVYKMRRLPFMHIIDYTLPEITNDTMTSEFLKAC